MQELNAAGFRLVDCAQPPFGGTDQRNICNLCGRGMGIQMEISRGLRNMMFRDLTPEGRAHRPGVFDRFVAAVRQAIGPFGSIYTETHPKENTD